MLELWAFHRDKVRRFLSGFLASVLHKRRFIRPTWAVQKRRDRLSARWGLGHGTRPDEVRVDVEEPQAELLGGLLSTKNEVALERFCV